MKFQSLIGSLKTPSEMDFLKALSLKNETAFRKLLLKSLI